MDMKDDLTPGSSKEGCPGCGGDAANEKMTVHSGPWERQFFQCASCGQDFAAAWRNSYYQPQSDTEIGIRAFAGAAA
jgi:hypothetical protein